MGKVDREEYKEVCETGYMRKLEYNDGDYKLSGKLAKHRECHITPDWFFIYE